MNPDLLDSAKGMLIGLAVGDAVGTTVEFKARGSFPPVTDMTGGGPFNLKKGQWTDDTSMALCLAASLIETKSFDPADQMARYSRWANEGYMSSTSHCFDIGNTVQQALHSYAMSGEPYSGSQHPRSAGNGSIMRLAPVVIANYRDRGNLLNYAGDSSRTTHGCEEAVESCRLFGAQLLAALQGAEKQDILRKHGYKSVSTRVKEIAKASYLSKSYDDLSGSGYVINTLETALWCFNDTDSFHDAILKTVNVGDDADTTAAVCGQIAGAFYGYQGIPESWRKALYMKDEIEMMAEQLIYLHEGQQ